MKKRTKHLKVLLSIPILLLALLFLIPSATVEAGGGFGSVVTTGVTDTKITISWTPSTSTRRPSGTNPYKICYKKAGAWVRSCRTAIRTSSSSYTITGLDSNTSYKIKVKCYCEKKNWRDRWKNPKWRKVGTLTQSTNHSPPDPNTRHGNVKVIGATASSLDVEVTYSHPGDFDFIRVCYKKTWNIASLNGTCRGINDPVNNWGSSTADRGWLEVTPAPSTLQVPFSSLSSCRQYQLVAYGFWPYSSTGVKIGEAKGHTGGRCGLFKMGQVVADDHTEVLEEYAAHLDEFYQRPLIEHLTEQYDSGLSEVHELLLQDGDEDIRDTMTLLTYLIDTDSEIFTAWQAEQALEEAEMTLDAFVQRIDPELYEILLEELDQQEE